MVKVDFFKSMKNTSFFKKYSKPFVLIAILIILSSVLFFSYNNYLLEDFTSKRNAKIEVMLWTDDNGSLENSFVKNEWLDLVAKYEKYATFVYGSFTQYVTYINGITKVYGKTISKKYTDEDLKNLKNQLPFVSIIVDIDKDRDYVGFASGTSLTTENIRSTLFSNINKDYRKLYTNAHMSTPTTNPSPGAATGPASQGPASTAQAPSLMKLPGT